MDDQIVEKEFGKFCDAFAEMREKMLDHPRFSAKTAARDKLYEAIRQFADEAGLTSPFIPVYSDTIDES
jgi:hypothetical protein